MNKIVSGSYNLRPWYLGSINGRLHARTALHRTGVAPKISPGTEEFDTLEKSGWRARIDVGPKRFGYDVEYISIIFKGAPGTQSFALARWGIYYTQLATTAIFIKVIKW